MISAKKKIFAYFQYLACLNKILQSLNFRIYSLTKILIRILSNSNFSFLAYYVSFNLMSRDIDIISAGISIFDDLAIFVMLKDFSNWKSRDFLYAVRPLSGPAVNILAMLPIWK